MALSPQEKKAVAQRARRAKEKADIIEQRWVMARARYETDPRESMTSIAELMGCTKQRVSQKARADAWKKAMAGGELAQAANLAADTTEMPAGMKLSDPIPPRPKTTTQPIGQADTMRPKTDDPVAEVVNDAVSVRGTVLSRHRREWSVPRALLQEAVHARHHDKVKMALRAAQALKVTQDGERKAWGLDLPDPPPPGNVTPTVTVRVLRETIEAVRPVTEDTDDDDD